MLKNTEIRGYRVLILSLSCARMFTWIFISRFITLEAPREHSNHENDFYAHTKHVNKSTPARNDWTKKTARLEFYLIMHLFRGFFALLSCIALI